MKISMIYLWCICSIIKVKNGTDGAYLHSYKRYIRARYEKLEKT